MRRIKTIRLIWKKLIVLVLNATLLASGQRLNADTTPPSVPPVTIYPAPAGAPLSALYTVQVQSQDIPVYMIHVDPEDPQRRALANSDKVNTGTYFHEAAFVYFDIGGAVEVSVTCKGPVTDARVLPDSFGIRPTIEGNTVHFTVNEPRNLTLVVNHELVSTLHLFANPMEKDVPSKDDPNVIYYGPGVHDVSNVVVGSGKTVYIAGGAIVRGVVKPGEVPVSVDKHNGLKTYKPTFELHGENIQFRGRGILDGSLTPAHGKNLLDIKGQNISLEGVILRDASQWTMPVRDSEHVTITNLKLLGYRANSDGMDLISSRDVTVQYCFIRTLDDLVTVKSYASGEVSNNLITHNVLWNEGAHALTIGTNTQRNITDVKFVDNDIIRDLGGDYSLMIFQGDSGLVSNILFENIRINQDVTVLHGGLIGMEIEKTPWSKDPTRGSTRNVVFKDIQAVAYAPTPFPKARRRIQLTGESDTSDIEEVRFENVVINGQRITPADVHKNRYVKAITIQ